MNGQIELWHLVTLLMAFFAMCGATGKVLLSQFQKHMDQRFIDQEGARKSFHTQLQSRLEGIEKTALAEANEWKRVERELLELKADLPQHYVRREDYIRGQSVIESKLDALYNKMENAQLRAIINEKGISHVA